MSCENFTNKERVAVITYITLLVLTCLGPSNFYNCQIISEVREVFCNIWQYIHIFLTASSSC